MLFTGLFAFVAIFADLLALPIEDVGEMSFQVDEEPPPVSNTCVVFAKSEATALLREDLHASPGAGGTLVVHEKRGDFAPLVAMDGFTVLSSHV